MPHDLNKTIASYYNEEINRALPLLIVFIFSTIIIGFWMYPISADFTPNCTTMHLFHLIILASAIYSINEFVLCHPHLLSHQRFRFESDSLNVSFEARRNRRQCHFSLSCLCLLSHRRHSCVSGIHHRWNRHWTADGLAPTLFSIYPHISGVFFFFFFQFRLPFYPDYALQFYSFIYY